MITIFETYTEQETNLIVNDLIDYFNENNIEIQNFISKLFKYKTKIKFYCKHCEEFVDGVTHHKHSYKIHKGVIQGYSYGFQNEYSVRNIYLSFHLNQMKYTHIIDTDKTVIIYGDVAEHLKKIIEEIEMKKTSNKYNI